MNDHEFIHRPVLMDEVLTKMHQTVTNLSNSPQKLPSLKVVDCTLGGAGHCLALLKMANTLLPQSFKIEVWGFDQDPVAQKISETRISEFIQKSNKSIDFKVIPANFSQLGHFCDENHLSGEINFVLGDFGVSSPQLDQAHRGFSFMKEGPLDMRMNPHSQKDCKSILETYSEDQLNRLFSDYGEEPRARKLARAIIQDRDQSTLPVSNTLEFAQYVQRVLSYYGSRVHPATRIFQALRMEVNDEMSSIHQLLEAIPKVMSPHGTACFITFHSLEDRAIKQSFRAWQDAKNIKESLKSKKIAVPLLPWETSKSWGKESPRGGETAKPEEIASNPRSRSARLRSFTFNEERRS